MRLIPDPARSLVDRPPRWRVEDVEPGSTVQLTVLGNDAAGHAWQSVQDYVVGEDGTLQISDLDAPFASMRFTDQRKVPVAFTAPDGTWRCIARAATPTASSQVSILRDYGRALGRQELRGGGWLASGYLPAHTTGRRPGVLIVPGSTGRAAMEPTAALLASHGYPTAVMAYMQAPGLATSFREIPVEVVHDALTAFRSLEQVDSDAVAVWAVSVGTALALSALSGPDAPQVSAVIATSPTDVVWQALGAGGRPPKLSSLTRAGQPLPWLPIRGRVLMGQLMRIAITSHLPGLPRSRAVRLWDAYAKPHRDAEAVTRAAIPVQNITAPLLTIAGEADAIWPSAEMARSLIARRAATGDRPGDTLLTIAGAGHFLRPPATPTTVDRSDGLISGGTPDGIASAQRRAWNAQLEFLGRTLGPATPDSS